MTTFLIWKSWQFLISQISACVGDSGSPLTYQVAQIFDFSLRWKLTAISSGFNFSLWQSQPWFIYDLFPTFRLIQKFTNFWVWSAGGKARVRTHSPSLATSPVRTFILHVISVIVLKTNFSDLHNWIVSEAGEVFYFNLWWRHYQHFQKNGICWYYLTAFLMDSEIYTDRSRLSSFALVFSSGICSSCWDCSKK